MLTYGALVGRRVAGGCGLRELALVLCLYVSFEIEFGIAEALWAAPARFRFGLGLWDGLGFERVQLRRHVNPSEVFYFLPRRRITGVHPASRPDEMRLMAVRRATAGERGAEVSITRSDAEDFMCSWCSRAIAEQV